VLEERTLEILCCSSRWHGQFARVKSVEVGDGGGREDHTKTFGRRTMVRSNNGELVKVSSEGSTTDERTKSDDSVTAERNRGIRVKSEKRAMDLHFDS
jgi:hypothetical protein